MSENRLVATCLLGLEGLVADELRRMDIKNVEPQNGRVLFFWKSERNRKG